jgi:hypothetical protein
MLALVHIHKTAGTTLDDILARSYGVRHCYLPPVNGKTWLSADDYRRVQKLCPPLDSIAGHYVSAFSDLDIARPDIRYYTFLREPLVRCASHYQYQLQQQGKRYPFEEWIVRHVKRNPQTARIAGRNGTVSDAIEMLKTRFFFTGLVERFDESLVIFRQRVGDPRLAIGYRRRRVAENDDIKNELLADSRTRALIIEANRLDIELYEYAIEHLYPAFQRAYEGDLGRDVAAFKQSNGVSGGLRPHLNLLANRYVSSRFLNLKRSVSYYR